MSATISIRKVQVIDAESMVRLNEVLSKETPFMLMTTDEISTDVEIQQQMLKRIVESDDVHLLVAEADARLIGFVAATRKRFERVRHCFSLVIGVERAYWGQGVGSHLMTEIEQCTQSTGAERLELTVVKSNARAVQLYHRSGFTIEGTRRSSMRIGDELVDELYMAKILERQT